MFFEANSAAQRAQKNIVIYERFDYVACNAGKMFKRWRCTFGMIANA